jgi:CheY-like chemotaxis protein
VDGICRLVTSNNVDVFRLLGAQAVGRLGLEYAVAADHDELLALVRTRHPQIALVDVELAGGSGFAACRALKADPATARTHVVLLLDLRRTGGRLDKAALDEVAAAGADDVMALPIHPDDFYYHLARLSGLAFRQGRRIGVVLEVAVPGGGRGQVVNVSAGGVGVRVDAGLTVGTTIAVRFEQAGAQSPDTRVIVAWCRAAEDGFAAGLRFDGDPPMKTRLLLEQVALFDATATGTALAVSLHGDFTEMTRFDALSARLVGATEVEFDLAAVRYLSSAGVRAWCHFLDQLQVPVRFRHCSIAFATQAAMVPMVLGAGEVMSLEAPYLCETCDRDDLRLLEPGLIARDGDRLIPPRLHCGTCAGELVFDDVPERYFAFLRD